MMSHGFAHDTTLATLLSLFLFFVYGFILFFFLTCFTYNVVTFLFFLFISHLSLPDDMKSCVLKFLDIATSDKNAWQRRSFFFFLLSFTLPPKEGVFCYFFFFLFLLVDYQSLGMNGFY